MQVQDSGLKASRLSGWVQGLRGWGARLQSFPVPAFRAEGFKSALRLLTPEDCRLQGRGIRPRPVSGLVAPTTLADNGAADRIPAEQARPAHHERKLAR